MEYHNIKVTDLTVNIRDWLFEELERIYVKDDELEDGFELGISDFCTFFDDLKERVPGIYSYLVGMLFTDYFVMLNNRIYLGSDVEGEREDFAQLLRCSDVDDVIGWVEEEPDLLAVMCQDSEDLHSESMDIHLNLLSSCKKYDSWLIKIWPAHILDKLYFCLPYTVSSLMDCYQEEIDDLVKNATPYPVAIKNSKNYIFDLLFSIFNGDDDNYFELMGDIIDIFYVYTKYKNIRYKRNYLKLLLTLIEDNSVHEMIQYFVDHRDVYKKLIFSFLDYMSNPIIPFEEAKLFVRSEEEKGKTFQLRPPKIEPIKPE